MTDLEFLPAFLAKNDPGAPAHIEKKGRAVFDKALTEARTAAALVTDNESCRKVLREYLRTYRSGHLNVMPAPGVEGEKQAKKERQGASLRVLSKTTVLLTLPSFGDDQRDIIINLLKNNADAIATRPNLIVDVRNNDGGSDGTYEPVMSLIESNPYRSVGAEFLATPDNIKATENVCAIYAPTSEQCKKMMGELTSVMRAAKPGSYIRPAGNAEAIEIVRPEKVAANPKHVAVLIDKPCVSSCEEFVLAARQSYKVKLFGRSTAGCLDYSNMRPFQLPSGKRLLLYATSRTLRLPHLPVDVAGIPPDQYLPNPNSQQERDAEVTTVQQVLDATY